MKKKLLYFAALLFFINLSLVARNFNFVVKNNTCRQMKVDCYSKNSTTDFSSYLFPYASKNFSIDSKKPFTIQWTRILGSLGGPRAGDIQTGKIFQVFINQEKSALKENDGLFTILDDNGRYTQIIFENDTNKIQKASSAN